MKQTVLVSASFFSVLLGLSTWATSANAEVDRFGAFGDSHEAGDVSLAKVAVPVEQQKDVTVVGENCPGLFHDGFSSRNFEVSRFS